MRLSPRHNATTDHTTHTRTRHGLGHGLGAWADRARLISRRRRDLRGEQHPQHAPPTPAARAPEQRDVRRHGEASTTASTARRGFAVCYARKPRPLVPVLSRPYAEDSKPNLSAALAPLSACPGNLAAHFLRATTVGSSSMASPAPAPTPSGARPAAPRPSQPPSQKGGGPPRPQQQGARPPAPGGQQAPRMQPGASTIPDSAPLCSRTHPSGERQHAPP